jgi:hypothetical protein
VRARVPGALILFLLRSSPSRFDVNDLQLDISLVPLSALSSPSVFLLLSFFLCPSDGAEERPSVAVGRGNVPRFSLETLAPPPLPPLSLSLSLSLSDSPLSAVISAFAWLTRGRTRERS